MTTQTTPAPANPMHETVRQSVVLPPSFNYIGAFLTFRCSFRCSYCINRFGGGVNLCGRERSGAEWLRFLGRIEGGDVPITLQGGEPGLHPDFMQIVKEALEFRPVDILTNLEFDLAAFARAIDPARMNREAPYAPIRVSYHPEQFTLTYILERLLFLHKAGFRVGLYAVEHPRNAVHIDHAKAVCADLGVDFRTKPFLGWHEGRLQGQYAYPNACSSPLPAHCECAPSELLIAPDGLIHRCHHHLYSRIDPVADMGDNDIALSDDFHPCAHFGRCNPCDVKLKNNRFQNFGHVSVRIRPSRLQRAG